MPKSTKSINQDLEDLLITKGYDVTPLDSSGKEVPVASDAELMQFHFHKDGKDYGTVTATIDGLQKLTIYYDDEIANSGGINESDDGTSWFGLLKQIKKFAQQRQLGFVLKDTDRLRNDMKRRNHTKKLEESKVKELSYDLKNMSSAEFEKEYKMTKAEARKELKPKKKVDEQVGQSDSVITGTTKDGREIFWLEMNHKNPERSMSGIGRPDNGTEGRSIGYVTRDNQGLWREMTSDIGRVPYDYGNKPHPEEMTADQVFQRIKSRMAKSGTQVRPIEGYPSKQTKLDELDKKTLARYAKAAPKSADEIRKRASDFSRMGWDARDEGNTEEQDKWWGKAGDLVNKADRRTRGHDKAVDRLVKENKKLDEGYYGNKKMSYSDDIPTVKMVIKHNRQLEETDQRFRHIEKIFLETSDGERFGVPTNKPSRARAFARHIAEGGNYRDQRWDHITEICEDLDKLGGFVRATHNKREQFNESAQRMINEAQEQYNQLRETFKKLSGSKGYNKYFESYEPRVINEDDGDLSEAFMSSSIDTRIESALPTLSKFGIKMGKINEADMFEDWADSMIDEALDPSGPRQMKDLEELLSDAIPMGPNAEVAIGELSDIIEDDELFNSLRKAAKTNPDADARPHIVKWMREQNDEDYLRMLDNIDTGASEPKQKELPNDKQNRGDSEGLKEGDMELAKFKKMLRLS